MGDLSARLDRLMEQMEKNNVSKIRVTYADGHTGYLTAGACIDLAMNSPDTVERFEAKGKGHGLLPELLNSVLEI